MKKPILVTGSHRSGSTWIGKMISKSSKVGYIHEPFNLSVERYDQPFTHWFEFISEYCSQDHQDKVEAYMHSFLGWPSGMALKRLVKSKSFYDTLFWARDTWNLRRRLGQRTLFKDPIALLSAEWLYAKLACDVIVTVRHPAAFVASLKVKGWEFDFHNFSDQKNLMRVHLEDYRSEIERYSNEPADVIQQGIVLWNALYATVANYEQKYGEEWLFVKHEDLSLDPVNEYKRIFNYIDVPFTKSIEEAIVGSTTATESEKHKRDAAKNISTWKNRLTSEEIQTIKEGTRIVWQKFYSESDW